MKHIKMLFLAIFAILFCTACNDNKTGEILPTTTQEITIMDESVHTVEDYAANNEVLLRNVTVGDSIGDIILEDPNGGYLYICKFVSNGKVLWQTEIGEPHPANKRVYLTELDGMNYIFIYIPEMWQGTMGASMKLISTDKGKLFCALDESWTFTGESDAPEEYTRWLDKCIDKSRFVCGFDENGRILE